MARLDTQTRQDEPISFLAEQTHHDKTYNPFAHDALHCKFCTTDKKILQVAATQASILQTLLNKFQESEGTPHGTPFNFITSAPVQNTVYASPQVPNSGVVRSLVIGGNGNITLKLVDPRNKMTGGLLIATLPCNGTSVVVPHRFTIPPDATFSLSTDSSAGTGILSLSAWIEPVAASNTEFFQIRRA